MTSRIFEVPLQPYAGEPLVIDLLVVPDLRDELKMAGDIRANFTRMSRPTFFDVKYIHRMLLDCCVLEGMTEEIKEGLVNGLLAAVETYIKYMLQGVIELCEHRCGNELLSDSRYVVDNDMRSTMMFLNDREMAEFYGSDDEPYGPRSRRWMMMMRSRYANTGDQQIRLESTNNTALLALGARKAFVTSIAGQLNATDQTSYAAAAESTVAGEEPEAPLRSYVVRIKHMNVKDVMQFMEEEKRYKKSKLLYDAYITYKW